MCQAPISLTDNSIEVFIVEKWEKFGYNYMGVS